MFQSFTPTTRPEQGPPRLALLREELARRGLAGFIVPRADAYQGEYVAPCDERLSWLTGFTGSAGFCIVLRDRAGLFVDGRYRLQVRAETAPDFTPVDWPETSPGDWLDAQGATGRLGFDPWLHTPEDLRKLACTGVEWVAQDTNPVDAIWTDRPGPPVTALRLHPDALAGATSAQKRAAIAKDLRAGAVVLTLPDSLSWLLNIRGADVPHNPVVHCMGVLHRDASLDLFIDPAKTAALPADPAIRLQPPSAMIPLLRGLNGTVQVDPASAPVAVVQALAAPFEAADPCQMPKACKTEAELCGMRAAHLRDGAAVTRFLHWFDRLDGAITEIEAVRALEGFRTETGALLDISFPTIAGAGPNGAIVHYRVTEATNRRLDRDSLFLIDSGAQYPDGTTDITRTLPVGTPPQSARAAFTAVLQGMIAISTARFARGVAGGHLDALARAPLWRMGMDYDHGTGHGVGAALSVHEGPVRISRVSTQPLRPGMILSNEPGLYRAGEWGIRIENLIAVRETTGLDRPLLEFETLTLAPIDRRLILIDRLAPWERDWLNAYHARVMGEIGPLVPADVADWLARACAPL
jgi:Xaa-Pro aminopeptidase